MARTYRVLIINPNSSVSMTEALRPIVDSLGYNSSEYLFFTAPLDSGAPRSINSQSDGQQSAQACLPHLLPMLNEHDAFLVACYSEHPLVGQLRDLLPPRTPVLGIFEASVGAALQICGGRYGELFGIVSTGKVWKELLSGGVRNMLGGAAKSLFVGVETTGLSAVELHEVATEEVETKVKDAARRLCETKGLAAILLGCAGMSGMEDWIREVVDEEVVIIDGIKAGVGALQALLRA